jgi:cytidine deaminase
MNIEQINISIQVFDSSDELNKDDQDLVMLAREATSKSYAPYSHFTVGAAAVLNNGEKIIGSNQENAAYSVSICAERTLLSNASMLFPGVAIKTLAVSYHNLKGNSDTPISPCGVCRQALSEHEDRTHQTIRIILSGQTGKVYIIDNVSDLLPLSFRSSDLIG